MNRRLIVLVAYAALSIFLACRPTAIVAKEQEDVTYIIPIEGNIEKALLYVIRRGIRQAEFQKAGAIILVIDTPGGQLDAADEIVRNLLQLTVPTYCFIKAHAFSAGAIIAMATDHIYMAPGSVIGAATPMMITPTGGLQQLPEALEEKMVSGVSALIRSTAQQKGHDPQLAEAMVRREKQYAIGEKIISPAGELLTLTNVEAEQPAGTEGLPILSSGTVKNMEELLERIGRSGTRIETLKVTGAERLARIIASLSIFLLAGGLLGLYIEFKTPGFGIFGISGVLCLLVFFWGHHIAGLAGMEDLLLFLLGAALLLIEVFFIPGFGIVGLAGFALIILGLLSAMTPGVPGFAHFSFRLPELQNALLALAGAMMLAGFMAYFLFPRANGSGIFSRVALDTAAGKKEGFTATATRVDLIGVRGKALSPLRPAGTGEFEGQRLDIITTGEFIEAGTLIQIVDAKGRRIVVERTASS